MFIFTLILHAILALIISVVLIAADASHQTPWILAYAIGLFPPSLLTFFLFLLANKLKPSKSTKVAAIVTAILGLITIGIGLLLLTA